LRVFRCDLFQHLQAGHAFHLEIGQEDVGLLGVVVLEGQEAGAGV
jgi:hypothetical protein